jgi:hypothetical protein
MTRRTARPRRQEWFPKKKKIGVTWKPILLSWMSVLGGWFGVRPYLP